jgi:hypothetical protein
MYRADNQARQLSSQNAHCVWHQRPALPTADYDYSAALERLSSAGG